VFITSDSITSTLTITDKNGLQYSKAFVFFKGIQSDLKLMASDTIVCAGDTITVYLQGNKFVKCAYNAEPYQYYISSGFRYTNFNAIGDICKYVAKDSHSLALYPAYEDPLLPLSLYCINTTPINILVKQDYSQTENIVVCQEGVYTFPDGTVQTNIIGNTTHTSHFSNPNFCDSVITTNITVSDFQASNSVENITLCPGNSYTFPDGTIQNSITGATTHYSHFNGTNGCDSVITTNIILGSVNNDTIEVAVCSGDSYIFPDNTTQTNIISNTSHISRFNSILGCDSIINTIVTVKQIDTSVTRNNLAFTSNSNLSTYQWFNCLEGRTIAGAELQSYTATTVGSYAVIVSKNGCVDTSSCYVITSSDIHPGGRPLINIYPVPVRNSFSLVIYSESATIVELSLTNFLGHEVMTEKINLQRGENNLVRNISALAAGIYTLKILKKDTNVITIKRVLKQ
jgi:Secretion system C-terminal sorting domain